MTLFELTVVNNWFILMNAYAFTTGMYTRIYFMIFYLVTMIVLTIVVSSFLEAFRFRIQYKQSTSKHDGKHATWLMFVTRRDTRVHSIVIVFRGENASRGRGTEVGRVAVHNRGFPDSGKSAQCFGCWRKHHVRRLATTNAGSFAKEDVHARDKLVADGG